MNYLALLNSLKKEAVAALSKPHSQIERPYNILAVIALIPVYIITFFTEIGYAILVFFFNAASSGIRYLENWVDNKKKDVNMATEAVLYFITMPTIFFFNVFFSIFTIFFYLIWFSLQILYYIISLGGTKWQPFIMDAKFDDSTEYAPVYSITARRAWSVVAFSLFILLILFSLFGAGETVTGFISVLYTVSVTVLIPLFFKKAPVAEANVEVATEPEAPAAEEVPIVEAEPAVEENTNNND